LPGVWLTMTINGHEKPILSIGFRYGQEILSKASSILTLNPSKVGDKTTSPVNSSRAIMGAWKKEVVNPIIYAISARNEAIRMRNDLNTVR